MLQQTKGLIIRTVKYGDSSLVVTAFTELFGVQSYMVNGIRTNRKATSISIGHLQPGNLLDMVVYQREKATLQRMKDCRLLFHGQNIDENMSRNAVLLFIVELLQKCLKQPDPHPELFYFLEDIMAGLNEANPLQTANLPVFYMLHLSHFFGFRLMNNYTNDNPILDLNEGQFMKDVPTHGLCMDSSNSKFVADLLKVMQVAELDQIPLNRKVRNELIDTLSSFYALHVPSFGTLKSLPVLRTLWED